MVIVVFIVVFLIATIGAIAAIGMMFVWMFVQR
jgi:hypothetical protein